MFFFRGEFVYVSLNFKAEEDLQCCWDDFFYLNVKEANEFLAQPCFETFSNCLKGLNNRLMSPAQTIAEWNVEKWAGKREQGKQTPELNPTKQKDGRKFEKFKK